MLFFFNDTATTEIYTLSLHDAPSDLEDHHRPQRALGGEPPGGRRPPGAGAGLGRSAVAAGAGPRVHVRRQLHRPGRPRSEEHTSELQSRQYLVCRLLLEKKNRLPTLL